MSDIVIEARSIGFDYPGGVPALIDLDLSVARGRRLAILGPNGAGKTTLLLHLNGTLRPKRGEIRLNGAPAGYTRAALRAWRGSVGLVLQEPDDQLFSANVRQDISFGPLNQGVGEEEARARVAAAVEALRIAHVVERPTHMLSFGQKKRVAIAGIMAMRPEVLVLDEPTAGLDPSGERHLMYALDGLHSAGTTMVFSTHNIDFAWGWADDVALFQEGKVVRQGLAEDILLDDALLKSVGMRPPLVADISRRLFPGDPPLRSRDALLERLGRA